MDDRPIKLEPGVLVMVKTNAQTLETGNAGRFGTILHWINNDDIITVRTPTGESLQLVVAGSGWLVQASREFILHRRYWCRPLPVLQLGFFPSSLLPIAGPGVDVDDRVPDRLESF